MGFLIFLAIAATILKLVSRLKKESQNYSNEDLEEAVNILMQLGFTKSQAVARVLEAKRNFPRGDITIIVNAAVR